MVHAAYPFIPCDLLHFAGYDVPTNAPCARLLLTDQDIRDFLLQRALGSGRAPKRVTLLIRMQYSLLRLLIDGEGLKVISR